MMAVGATAASSTFTPGHSLAALCKFVSVDFAASRGRSFLEHSNTHIFILECLTITLMRNVYCYKILKTKKCKLHYKNNLIQWAIGTNIHMRDQRETAPLKRRMLGPTRFINFVKYH